MADLNVSNVGKNQVQLSTLKAGLKEEDLKNDKEKSIFKSIDKDGNGVLDADELKQFSEAMDKSNDGIATKKEAKSYIKENDLKGVKKKDVLNFLENNNINTEDVKDTQIIEQNGQKLVQVEYNDGRKETIKPDRATALTQTDAEGNTVTESRDKDKNLTQKTTVATNGDETTVEYETTVDANGNPVPKKETSVTENGNKTLETNYESGKKVETTETVKSEGSKTVTQYDENEKPFTATKTQGLNETQYASLNGTLRETKKIENKGQDNQRTTNFTYDDENGTVTSVATEASVNGTKTTTTVKKDEDKLSETIVDGDKTTTTTKNVEGDGYTQVIQDGDKSTTTNQLNNEGHRISSTKVVDGKEYTLNYDGQGNTTGIIVQNGESPASIAKKFGCTEAQLREANQDVLGGKKYFDVGSEIKVPRELEADDKALQGRKSSQEAKAEFARDEQIRAQKRAEAQARQAEAAAKKAEAKARDKALREDLGLINYKGAGEKVQGDFYNKGKKTSSRTFTKIGNATHGRTICQDKSGKIYVVAHNGVVLKETWVNVSAHRDVQVVGNRRVAVEKGARDGHGRKTVYDGDGNAHVMSHDNKILKKEYVAKSDKSDAIRANSKTAQQATVEMMDSQLNSAQAAFDQQMKEDGWAGDVADGVSKIWGSDNTADKVRKDLAQQKANINQLKAAAKQGDGAFRAKFKQIYGVDYNQKAIADYNMNPTDANYAKAFGTKNNIGQRVAKYNASQQAGAAVVKTTAEVGAAVALTAATVATGGAAGVVAGMVVAGATTVAADVVVETTDRMSSEEGLKDGQFTEIMKDAAVDGTIAAATLGTAKGLNSAYKVGKAAYATSKVAGKAATVGEKAVATVAKAETGVSKVTTTAAKAETGVSKVTTTAAKAETGVSKVTTNVAKAETGVARTTTTATNAETGVARTTTTATKAETGVARTTTTATNAETGVARTTTTATNAETGVAKAETVAQKAETTATKAEDAAAKAGEAAQEAAGAGAKTSHIAEKVIDTTADVAVGATAEYIETGDVTLEGTAMNAAVGSIGIAGDKLGGKLKSSTKFQQVKEGVSDAYHNAKEKVSDGVSGAYQKAKDGVSGAYNSAKEKVSGAADNMKEKFSQRKANNTEGAASSQRTQGNESANRTNESGSSQKAQGNESANRTNESGSSQRAQGNESANRTKESGSSQKAQGAESANKTNETGSSQKAEGQARPMSEAEINERISNLEPKLTEAKVADEIKNEYADFLNGSITDDAEFTKQFGKLAKRTHADRLYGALDEKIKYDNSMFNALNDVRTARKTKDPRKIKAAYDNLKQVVNERASNLSKYEKEMGSLKAQANANNGAKVNEQAKAQEAQKSGAADKAEAKADNGAKVNEQAKAQEAPKADSAEKAQAKAKADNSAKAEQQGPTISTEDKIAMGQIGNQIHSAKNLSDLDKLQAQLDKIPDCAQKRNLQKQIDNAKKSFVDVEPEFEVYADIKGFKTGDKIPSGQKIAINGNEKFQVGKSELDLSSPEIQNRLKQMKDGEVLTIGREGDIKVAVDDPFVSRKHLAIQKDGDGFVIKDTSMNGTYIKGTEKANAKATTGVSDEIKTTFDKNMQERLSKLKNGQSASLNKGDWHYVVKNNNGQIVVVKKDGNVNFDIPMSDRTPVGEARRGSKMSEVLSPESKAVYRDSYAAYLNTKDMEITHNATNMITQDNLLHGTDLDALLGKTGILENGLVPREISGNASAHFSDGSVPMTLTPLCTDVWDVRQSSSIKDYFDANNSHWANNRGESNFLSNTARTASPITIVLDKKSMHPDLLNNSFNVNQTGRSPLIRDGGIGGIGDGAHDYPTHRAIPIGAPANAIDRIIVDTRAVSSKDIKAIQNKINKKGLDIDIYDINGNLLSQSKKN